MSMIQADANKHSRLHCRRSPLQGTVRKSGRHSRRRNERHLVIYMTSTYRIGRPQREIKAMHCLDHVCMRPCMTRNRSLPSQAFHVLVLRQQSFVRSSWQQTTQAPASITEPWQCKMTDHHEPTYLSHIKSFAHGETRKRKGEKPKIFPCPPARAPPGLLAESWAGHSGLSPTSPVPSVKLVMRLKFIALI